MPDTPSDVDELICRFATGPAALRAAWDGVPVEARQWRPGTGKWSAHEVVIHCADTSMVGQSRLRYMLAADDPVIVGWDQDCWAVALEYHAQPVEPAFAAIEATHVNTIPLLRRLTKERLARTSRHTERGRETVADWLRYAAEHMHAHARQIDRIVAAFESSS
jgi:hypothetical protein